MPTRRLANWRRAAVVLASSGTLVVVVGPGAWGDAQRGERLGHQGIDGSRSLCTKRAARTFMRPEARVIGLVAA